MIYTGFSSDQFIVNSNYFETFMTNYFYLNRLVDLGRKENKTNIEPVSELSKQVNVRVAIPTGIFKEIRVS